MSNCSDWFEDKVTSEGEVVGQIKKQEIYESLSNEIIKKIEADLPSTKIIDWIKSETSKAYFERYGLFLTVGSLNNAIGDWNEFMVTSAFSEIAIEINNSGRGLVVVIFPLPDTQINLKNLNQISSKFLRLIKPDAFGVDGEMHSINGYKNRIFFSSPDYVIASLERDCLEEVQSLLSLQMQKPDSKGMYNYLEETMSGSEIKAAVSVKTEYRPDRRYQPLFEANLVKQIGYATGHNWKFYMVASRETSADTSLFDRVTTPHASEVGYKLVDRSFIFLRKADLIPLVEDAIG